ncbi:hypothetical protein BBP40_007269 [Aspergillus hancockii]|nr:hypothetical protein BBP40_007269 [Aspergillus hancockii]
MPMITSLLALLGASLMLCLRRSASVYIIGRTLLGISGAVVWTLGLDLVVDTVSKDAAGKCLGFVFMSINMAVLMAPLIGGIIYAAAGFYAGFYISFGLIALDRVLRLGLVEKKRAQQRLRERNNTNSPTMAGQHSPIPAVCITASGKVGPAKALN